MEIASLHKRLLEPWSAATISKLISSSSILDDIRVSFSNFEKKGQMRILLALLDIEIKKRNELTVPIRKLLDTANKSDDDWIIITSGIVNNHLFGKSKNINDIDNNALNKISEIANVAIQRIKESSKLSTSQSFYFQPYEYRYLSSELTNGVTNQASENLNFVYTGNKPDFILREKHQFEKKSAESKTKTNLGAKINTNTNMNMNTSNTSLQKKTGITTISNPNVKTSSNVINKSKVMNIDSMKGTMMNPDQNKKRSLATLTSPLDKRTKIDDSI